MSGRGSKKEHTPAQTSGNTTVWSFAVKSNFKLKLCSPVTSKRAQHYLRTRWSVKCWSLLTIRSSPQAHLIRSSSMIRKLCKLSADQTRSKPHPWLTRSVLRLCRSSTLWSSRLSFQRLARAIISSMSAQLASAHCLSLQMTLLRRRWAPSSVKRKEVIAVLILPQQSHLSQAKLSSHGTALLTQQAINTAVNHPEWMSCSSRVRTKSIS